MSREFDLVIFGATGFTGFYVVRELLLSIDGSSEYSNLKWAIAGRNPNKLNETLKKIGEQLNRDLSDVVKIVADVSNSDSLLEMAKRTRLIINCVGPYHIYGQPVVAACVQQSTHHIDISGEPNYIESMAVEYYHKAVQKGLVIVSTCGWDSIPADLGVQVAKEQFKGRLHSVETFVQTLPGSHGYSINFGTLHSAIFGYMNFNKLRNIRRRLYTEVLTKKLPNSRIILKRKYIPFTRKEINGWNVEFPGSDRSVVQRTQYYNYEHFNEWPVQIQTYYVVSSFTHLLGLMLFGIMFAALVATSFGRRLLQSYPHVFTFGIFTKKGPSREQIESTRFQTFILGRGWSEELLKDEQISDMNNEPNADPDSSIMVKVSGRDPGYMATSTCIVQSGLTILYELDRIPKGVLTPASAFRDTKLLERLRARDLKIEVINE